jgi:hypothetical protein
MDNSTENTINESSVGDMDDRMKVLQTIKHNNALASKKLTKVQWETIEQSIPYQDRKVLEMLRDYGSGKDIKDHETKQVKKILSDKFYLEYRHRLVVNDEHIISDKNISTTSTTSSSVSIGAAEKIRIDNSKKIVEKVVMEVFASFNAQTLKATKALTHDILEIIIIGFIYSLWFYRNSETLYNSNKKMHYSRILSCIISAIKLVDYCEKDGEGYDIACSTRKIKVSSVAVQDLKSAIDMARKVFPFDIITIYEYAPNLVHSSAYDQYIPKGGMKPYNDQKQVVDFIRKNRDNNFVLSYETTVAGGKTTNVITIIALLKCLQGTPVVGNKKWNGKLLFVCNSNTVRNKVGGICYSMKVPFGMATIENCKVKIIKHFDTPTISLCECVIASPEAACELLKQDGANDNYLLFLDEPTIGADIADCIDTESSALHHNVNVMRHMPRWTILSSATLPPIEDLQCFIDLHKEKNEGTHVTCTISSKIVHVGCDFYDFQGKLIYPYAECKTGDELRKIIDIIKKDPFLGKKCTYNVALDLWRKCKKKNIPIIDVSKEFEDVGNISAEKVKDTILQILTDIADRPDCDIEYICTQYVQNDDDDNDNDNNDNNNRNIRRGRRHNLNINPKQSNKFSSINCEGIDLDGQMDKLGTSIAYKFKGLTLIAEIDPISFVQKYFEKLLQDVRNECGSFKSINNRYKKELEIFTKEYLRLKKEDIRHDEPFKSKKGVNDKQSSNIKKKSRNNAEDDNTKVISVEEQLSKLKQPKFGYPEFAKINTQSHYEKYADSTEKLTFRIPPPMEELPYDDMLVPDFLLDLLNCGIGVYAPSHHLITPLYTSYVEKFLKDGTLAYIVCSVDMGYGTDIAHAENVIITKNFSNVHSVPTINQMAGRVARPRQKRRGRVFMHESGISKINNYSRDPKACNIELKNMIDKFKQIEKTEEEHLLKVIKEFSTVKDDASNNYVTEVVVRKNNERDFSQDSKDKTPVKVVEKHNKPVVDNSTNKHVKKYDNKEKSWRDGSSISDEKEKSWRSSSSISSGRKYNNYQNKNKKDTDESWR